MARYTRGYDVPERAPRGVLKTGFRAIDDELMRSYDGRPLGGLPRGGFYEIFGSKESGKSRLAYHIMREEQARGNVVALCPAEARLQLHGVAEYIQALGVSFDSDKFLHIDPSDEETGVYVLEDVMLTMRELALSKAPPSLVVVDSLAALVPRADVEAFTKSYKSEKKETKFDSGASAVFAQSMVSALRQTIPACVIHGVTVLAINHRRQSPSPFRPDYAPGGTAKQHLLNAIILLVKSEYDPVTGNLTSKATLSGSNVSAQSQTTVVIEIPGPEKRDGEH